MSKIPLGKPSTYAEHYSPELLFPVRRDESRHLLGIGDQLPFHGQDLWNAWELTWLTPSGKPVVATATFSYSAASPSIVESKSLKLYLNSFAMSQYDSKDQLAEIMCRDLKKITGSNVAVAITTGGESSTDAIAGLPGDCIDYLDVTIDAYAVDASILNCDVSDTVSEELHSHLLRSNCPVTNQPDMGSVLVRYHGPRIDRGSLLRYIVSFRRHNDFHETCAERMFIDIKERCCPDQLTVCARFNRRGGLDINPFRSDFETIAGNPRLWRQ